MNFSQLLRCLTPDQKSGEKNQQKSFSFSYRMRWSKSTPFKSGRKYAWILKYSQSDFKTEHELFSDEILVIRVSGRLVNVMWGQVWGCEITFPLQSTRVPGWSLGKFTFQRPEQPERSRLNVNVELIAERGKSLVGGGSLWCENTGGVSSARSPKPVRDHNQVCTGGQEEGEMCW